MNTHHAFARMPRPLNIAARFAAFATITASAAFAASPGDAPLVPVIERLAGLIGRVETFGIAPDIANTTWTLVQPALPAGVETTFEMRFSPVQVSSGTAQVLFRAEVPDFDVALPEASGFVLNAAPVSTLSTFAPALRLPDMPQRALFRPTLAAALPAAGNSAAYGVTMPPSPPAAAEPARFVVTPKMPEYREDKKVSVAFNNTVAFSGLNLSDDDVEALLARIALSGLLDGSLNARNPEWRPHLAYLLSKPQTPNVDTVFSLLLTSCAGNTDVVKMQRALEWAEAHDKGRFLGTVSYFCARHYFLSGDYEQAISFCAILERDHPDHVIRAKLLKALVYAHKGDMRAAKHVLYDICLKHPDSPEMPEVRYMEAWIALQEMREAEAKVILNTLISDHPGTPAAGRAKKILKSLEEYQ